MIARRMAALRTNDRPVLADCHRRGALNDRRQQRPVCAPDRNRSFAQSGERGTATKAVPESTPAWYENIRLQMVQNSEIGSLHGDICGEMGLRVTRICEAITA